MSASAIRRAPIPRRSSQSCARWACDGRARGDDHGRHGGDGRCRRARSGSARTEASRPPRPPEDIDVYAQGLPEESATGPPSCPASSMRSPRRASASIAVVSTGTPAIAATAAGAPFSTRSLRPAPAAAFRVGDPARRVERRESHDARVPERRRTTRGARAPAPRRESPHRRRASRPRRSRAPREPARRPRSRPARPRAPRRSVSRHDGLRIGELPLRSGSRRARRGA